MAESQTGTDLSTLAAAESLARWLDLLDLRSCICPYEFQPERSYGISLGSGWVRQRTVPGCPHHG